MLFSVYMSVVLAIFIRVPEVISVLLYDILWASHRWRRDYLYIYA